MAIFSDPGKTSKLEQIEDRALPASVPIVTPGVVAASVGVAVFAASGSVVTVGCAVLPVLTFGVQNIRKWMKAKRFEREHGSIAHLIATDRDMIAYIKIVGEKVVAGQLRLALEEGQSLSSPAKKAANALLKPEELPHANVTAYLQSTGPIDAEIIDKPKAISAQDEKAKATPTGNAAIENRGNGADIILGDLVNLMVHEPKPTIISAVPRTGKGYLVNQVIERFKAKGFTVWVLQPKPAPAEFAYWKCADRFLGIDLENYQRDSEGITEVMQSFFFEWRQQNTSATPSILVIDELVKIQALMPKFYKDFLIPQCIVEGSSGETAGRYLYLLTQSPLVSDLGMSGGNRSTFEFIGLEKATSQNHAESIKKSVSGLGELPAVESYAKSPVGTLAYYSRLNGWVPMPTYAKPVIGPGDVLCPELDALVHPGSVPAPELIAELITVGAVAPTVTKVAPALPAPEGADDRAAADQQRIYDECIRLLKTSPNVYITLTKLIDKPNDRRRFGAALIGLLAGNANIGYQSTVQGKVTSHKFAWLVADDDSIYDIGDDYGIGEFDID